MKNCILIFSLLFITTISVAQTKAVVYFDSNKTELKMGSINLLDSLTNYVKDKKDCKIAISGYCDNTGIDRFNQILSDFRAQSVFNYFRNKNLNIAFTSIKGYSSSNPISDNTTETGKAKNRRAEIIITIPTVSEIKNEVSSLQQKQASEQKSTKETFSSSSSIKDLEIGKTLVLKNLNFEGGTATLLPEAKPTLLLLLKTMKENPTLEIEIGGHVCCMDDVPLSIGRAYSIYKYLIKNGIDASRMTYKGYSRNKPLFEDEHSPENQKANRRVEITVLKK